MFTLLDLCVSSLRKGHANLLFIVPVLADDLRRESLKSLRPALISGRSRQSWTENGAAHQDLAAGSK